MTTDPLMSYPVFIVGMIFILVFGVMATEYIVNKYENKNARTTRQRYSSASNTRYLYYNRNMDERKGA